MEIFCKINFYERGVQSTESLYFYSWESADLVQKVDMEAKHVIWNSAKNLVTVAAKDCFFILKYLNEVEILLF